MYKTLRFTIAPGHCRIGAPFVPSSCRPTGGLVEATDRRMAAPPGTRTGLRVRGGMASGADAWASVPPSIDVDEVVGTTASPVARQTGSLRVLCALAIAGGVRDIAAL